MKKKCNSKLNFSQTNDMLVLYIVWIKLTVVCYLKSKHIVNEGINEQKVTQCIILFKKKG